MPHPSLSRGEEGWLFPGTPLRSISGRFGVGANRQTVHHEIYQRFPVGKRQVARERAQMIEECLAGGQARADQPVMGVGEGEQRVNEKGQDFSAPKSEDRCFWPSPKLCSR